MKQMFWISILFGGCLSTAGAANLVTNGGFESGDLTGWTSGLGCNHFVSNANPHSGSFGYADATFGVSCTISQSVATNPGTGYTLDFWLFNNGSTQPNNFFASIDGVPVTQLANAAAFGWTEYTVPFIAANASTGLTFGFRHNDQFWYFDDVSVDSSVPEPASVALVAGAAALLLAARRKIVAQAIPPVHG